jgi:RNA polymerase sigma-70 factor (sigma-E family)
VPVQLRGGRPVQVWAGVCQPLAELLRDTGVNIVKERLERRSEQVPVVGVPEPFDRFYRREYRQVVALAYALSGSQSGVEDLAQDAFVAAFRDWERVGRYVDPGAWVRRVVANRSVSVWRRRLAELRAVIRLAGGAPTTPKELEPAAGEVWKTVRRLPTRQAQAVALRYLEDRSIEDIAAILECSTGAVKQHLFRARRRLAEQLDKEGVET